MEMQGTDNGKLMTSLTLSDFIDTPNTESLVSPRENDCVLLETNDISSASQRESSDINRDKGKKDNMNEKRKRDESQAVQIMNVPEKHDCSLGKSKEKEECFTTDASWINQKGYSSCSQQETSASFDIRNCDPGAISDLTSSDKILVQLKTEGDFELKQLSTFHSDLNQSSVLTDQEMIKHGKETSTFMENYSMNTSPGHLVELRDEATLESHIAKVQLLEGLRLCGKTDSEMDDQTATSADNKIESPDRILHQESESDVSPLQKLSSNFSVQSQVGTVEVPKKRRLESKTEVNDINTDNVDERVTMTTSLKQEKDPSYFDAVITPTAQINILPAAETKIQSMSSDSLVRDTPIQKSAKSKGPPPPVPKKPKNPFGKDVNNAVDKPRSYSELLQKNIKMGRRESALHVSEDKLPPDLDMLSFCTSTLDSPSYMYITGGFVTGFQPEVDVPTIDPDLDGEDVDLWTRLDVSQIRHILEKKAKMKGPPPPVPKKSLNPFVANESDNVLPISVSILKDTAGILTYESSDYKPYMYRTVQEEDTQAIFDADRDNFLVTCTSSDTLDDNAFLRFRPELIRQSYNLHEDRTHQSSSANVENHDIKVLEMSKTSHVKKPCQKERRLSPKKETFPKKV